MRGLLMGRLTWTTQSYLFKVDAAEFSRLDIHHSMISAGLGGLFPTPARGDVQHALRTSDDCVKPAVLDIGTGSGAWCIEMAKAFPDTHVVGMDLVPVKASSVPPPNCHFEVGNADTDLARMYAAESFNLIHARSMMQGVKDFSSFFKNVWRMLRPGGVFMAMDGRFTTWDEERQEVECKQEGQPGFSWFRKMIYHMLEVADTRNPNMHLMDRITDCVREMGEEVWEKVDSFDLYLPIGNFDSPTISPGQQLAGKLVAQNLSMMTDTIRPMLLSSSLKPEEVDRLASELREELKEPKVKQFSLHGNRASEPEVIVHGPKSFVEIEAQSFYAFIDLVFFHSEGPLLIVISFTPHHWPINHAGKTRQQRSQMNPQRALETDISPPAGLNNSSPKAILRELHGVPVNGLSDYPVDAAEFSRLDLHNAMFTASLGGPFPAPAREDIQHALRTLDDHPRPTILDIGTGSGAWCVDMARAFPNADVVGMDLVPVKASSVPPPNCRFEVGNANTDLAEMYTAESFDLVHVRSVLQGIKDFHSFFRNVWRMLRPGGILLVMDLRLSTWDEERRELEYKEQGQPGFNWFRKMLYHLLEAAKARNPSIHLSHRITECLQEMGDDIWEKVDRFDLYLPVGNFDSPTMSPNQRVGGKLFTENMSRYPDSVRPMLLNSGLTPEEMDRLTSELRAELREPKVEQFSQTYRVDEAEFSRLDLHHAMFTASLDGLFPAPAQEDIRHALRIRDNYPKPSILDIGTGSGAWCIDMATEFPDADVVGMDLVPIKASSVPPSNCHFEVGNADTDLATMYSAESFDLIHARSMMQGVKDFSSFFHNVRRMLRPGGVLLMMDGQLTTWDEDNREIQIEEEGQPGFSWFRKMLYHMEETIRTKNPNMRLMHRVTDCVRGMGDDVWEKVDRFDLYIPIGYFDSPTMSPSQRLGGKFFAQNISMLTESVRPMLLSSSLAPGEVDRLALGVKKELKEPQIKQFFQRRWRSGDQTKSSIPNPSTTTRRVKNAVIHFPLLSTENGSGK
ncbi:hypothetical protein FRC01_007571 [Tulasnella sp. 417]|nr:hypothetical protein FRC01_007571 [Tulasnella sp. 417]